VCSVGVALELALFRSGEALGGVVDIADLLAVFSSPEANDVVNF
jgi:hypothetical protein